MNSLFGLYFNKEQERISAPLLFLVVWRLVSHIDALYGRDDVALHFEFEDTLNGFVDTGLAQTTILDRAFDGGVHGGNLLRACDIEEHVTASLERQDASFGLGECLAIQFDAAHLQTIGDDDAVIAELVAQDIGDEGVRELGRILRIDGRYHEVGRHDKAWTVELVGRLDKVFEGREVRVKLVAGKIDARQDKVRVICVAPGDRAQAHEVFERANDSAHLHRFQIRGRIF